jgi:hypothetical protein
MHARLFVICIAIARFCVFSNTIVVIGQVELHCYHLYTKSDRFRNVLNYWHCNTKQFKLMLQGYLINSVYIAARIFFLIN